MGTEFEKGLEHKEWLRELKWFSLQERRLRDDLLTLHFLTGGSGSGCAPREQGTGQGPLVVPWKVSVRYLGKFP